MFRALIVIIGLSVVDWLLCWLVWPWWVPDVTLVSVVLLIAAEPRRWLVLAATAGLLAMCWTVPMPAMALAWYGGLGASLRGLGRIIDLGDLRVQLLVIGFAEALWLALHVWLQSALSISLVGWSVVHIAATLIAVPWLRRVVLCLAS